MNLGYLRKLAWSLFCHGNGFVDLCLYVVDEENGVCEQVDIDLVQAITSPTEVPNFGKLVCVLATDRQGKLANFVECLVALAAQRGLSDKDVEAADVPSTPAWSQCHDPELEIDMSDPSGGVRCHGLQKETA